MRLLVRASCCFVGALVTVAACIPHPSADYEEFLDKTNDLRNAPAPDGGGTVIEASVPIEATEGQFLAACLPSLSGPRADLTLRFYAETKFTPSESGDGTGTLSLVLNPLPVAGRSFEKSASVGTPLVVGESLPVTNEAKFSGTVARAEITAAANTLSPRDIVVENIVLNGQFASEGNFCSDFVGRVTQPLNQPITAQCTYFAMQPGDTFEVIAPSVASADTALVIGGTSYGPDTFGCAQ